MMNGSARDRIAWAKTIGYFVIFFAATSLSGVMFLLGGIAIVLVPGSLPLWLPWPMSVWALLARYSSVGWPPTGRFAPQVARRSE
jgi:hypothetical protein